jgi:radical SAM superfamily enzyme YgiQ (UPF0313 family)
MLDLLLTHAYFLRDDPHEQQLMRPFPPLGLQYLVAWLRRENLGRVDWWDSTFQEEADFERVLQETDPQTVGFYGHTLTRSVTARLVKRCREQGRRVVAGGPDPVQYLAEYLEMGVEVVVIGEGEETLTALMHHLKKERGHWNWEHLKEIPGIAFQVHETTVKTPARSLLRPLDRLPYPHRARRDLDRYFNVWKRRHGKTAMSLSTSRGCPYRCTWCSKQVYGDTFRRRSVEHVIQEARVIKQEYGPDELWFVDDMFTLNRRWVLEFCRDFSKVELPFYLIGRGETLNEELVQALKGAGCYRIYLSAESGSQKVLDRMEKGTDLVEIYRAADLLRKYRIELGIFVMLGYPGETRSDVLATIRMIRKLAPEVTLVSVAHPMKGTAFYTEVEKEITGIEGGRLTFKMPYSRQFYQNAERLIWTEEDIRKNRPLSGVLKWPLYRAGLEFLR